MADIVGIVNSPQFNTNVFRIGKAIHIVGRCKSYSLDRDCIIQKSTPLSLKVVFVNDNEDVDDIVIEINEVVRQNVRLTLLKEDK